VSSVVKLKITWRGYFKKIKKKIIKKNKEGCGNPAEVREIQDLRIPAS